MDGATLIAKRGPALAALLAALTALPGLWLPFLADDWADLAMTVEGTTARTPFGYFRPLCMATYRLEARIWGLSPSLSHLTNLVLIAAVAGLVVVAIRRYTGDPFLAGVAGLLFALHPYHVESAAWIAARADPLYSLFFVLAALAYDRWRETTNGWPVTALILFEASLLSKEAAVTLPAFLLFVGFCDRRRRPGRREWLRGYLPLAGAATVHFLVLRSWLMDGPGMRLGRVVPSAWIKKLLALGTSSLLPAHTEWIEARPLLWGGAAVLTAGTLLLVAWRRSGRVPPVVWVAAPAFVLLVGPHVISFQGRYLFLPSASSALAIAALLRAGGRRIGAGIALIVVLGWSLASGADWIRWGDAARASKRLIADLVEASRRPEVREIVVANMPHRVHAAPVAADMSAAVLLSGGRPVTVRFAAAVDYPTPSADALDGPPEEAIQRPPPIAEVRLRIPAEPFSRYVWPLPQGGSIRLENAWTTILFEGPGQVLIRIAPSPAGDRAGYVWRDGGLERLF